MPAELERLKKRHEFLRVAAVRKSYARPGLVLQMARRPHPAGEAVRVGFTASRKVGSAVVRNRARRRLRAAAREILPAYGQAGADYVMIARTGTVNRPYAALCADLKAALKRLSGPRRS